jgi:hypothetical protein
MVFLFIKGGAGCQPEKAEKRYFLIQPLDIINKGRKILFFFNMNRLENYFFSTLNGFTLKKTIFWRIFEDRPSIIEKP